MSRARSRRTTRSGSWTSSCAASPPADPPPHPARCGPGPGTAGQRLRRPSAPGRLAGPRGLLRYLANGQGETAVPGLRAHEGPAPRGFRSIADGYLPDGLRRRRAGRAGDVHGHYRRGTGGRLGRALPRPGGDPARAGGPRAGAGTARALAAPAGPVLSGPGERIRPVTATGRPAPSPLAAQRLRTQLLSGAPARTVAGVTGHLLAIQAQDPRGARLAVRARTSGLLATDVDDALTADRSVVVSWLNRGTLHLVLAEDYWWLHQLTTPQLATGNARRLAQEGVPPADADRAVGVIERSLAAAADRDLAKWAGLPLGDARRGLAAIAPGLAERDDGLASPAAKTGGSGPEEEPAVPDLRLLGAFDPLLLGWASRELFLAPGGPVITSNGLFRPFVLVQGRGTALWTVTGGKVVTDPLGPLTAPERAALAAEAADVERFLARPRETVGARRARGA